MRIPCAHPHNHNITLTHRCRWLTWNYRRLVPRLLSSAPSAAFRRTQGGNIWAWLSSTATPRLESATVFNQNCFLLGVCMSTKYRFTWNTVQLQMPNTKANARTTSVFFAKKLTGLSTLGLQSGCRSILCRCDTGWCARSIY